MARVAVIPGDGIGREVIPSAVRVLEALSLDLSFEYGEAGDAVLEETSEALPEATRALARDADVTLFGAAGETAADVILPLRQIVSSFVNIRPARTYPGVDAVQPGTDIVFLRENTEGVYAGFESELTEDVTTLTRLVTRTASRRLGEFACDYVSSRDSSGFTVAHKANVMRVTDGVFVEEIQSVAARHGVETESVLMDALAMYLVMNPEEFDVIVAPNLAGDVLSDLAAGLVGGLGLLPSANIGPDRALFEPVHGTASDIAGAGIANPTAAVLSAAMLLGYLDEYAAADRVRKSVNETLEAGPKTPDLGGESGTEEMTTAFIDKL